MNGGDGNSAKYFKRIIPPSSSNREADSEIYQAETSVGPRSMKELLIAQNQDQ